MSEYTIWFLIIGAVAGWLAGLIMRGHGFGVLGNILLGIVGAVFGGWLFNVLNLSAYGTGGALVMSLVGAVAVLGLISVVKRA